MSSSANPPERLTLYIGPRSTVNLRPSSTPCIKREPVEYVRVVPSPPEPGSGEETAKDEEAPLRSAGLGDGLIHADRLPGLWLHVCPSCHTVYEWGSDEDTPAPAHPRRCSACVGGDDTVLVREATQTQAERSEAANDSSAVPPPPVAEADGVERFTTYRCVECGWIPNGVRDTEPKPWPLGHRCSSEPLVLVPEAALTLERERAEAADQLLRGEINFFQVEASELRAERDALREAVEVALPVLEELGRVGLPAGLPSADDRAVQAACALLPTFRAALQNRGEGQ